MILDMDGTITISNSWEDLHEYFGTVKEARKNKELYLEGKITYQEWVERDVALWNRPSYEEVKKVLLNYEVREGFEDFCNSLHSNAILAIVSGGIDVRALDIKAKYGLHEAFANSLVMREGRVVSGSGRVEITVCIGDNEFDKDMLESGDVGIVRSLDKM